MEGCESGDGLPKEKLTHFSMLAIFTPNNFLFIRFVENNFQIF